MRSRLMVLGIRCGLLADHVLELAYFPPDPMQNFRSPRCYHLPQPGLPRSQGQLQEIVSVDIDKLHMAIGMWLVERPARLDGAALRFLRRTGASAEAQEAHFRRTPRGWRLA